MKLPKGYVPGVGLVKTDGGFGGFGQRMLEKMGWNRGQGLGKDKTGMTDAIEVAKKEDTLGVGATHSGWKWDWKYWEDAYNGAIKGVQGSGGDDSGRTTSSSSGREDRSGSNGGCGARPRAQSTARSAARQKGSSRRGSPSDNSSGSSSSSSDDSSEEDEPALGRLMACAVAFNCDGTLATASAAELAIAQGLAKGPWVAGRFGGREGKMARIRAQEERLAAEARSKLGAAPANAASGGAASSGGGAAAAAAAAACAREAPGPPKKRKARGAGPDMDGAGPATDADSSRAAKKTKKTDKKEARKTAVQQEQQQVQGQQPQQQQQQQQQQQGRQVKQQLPHGQQQDAGEQPARPKNKTIVVSLKGEDARPAMPFKPTPATGWWGEKMFRSAGRLEGMGDDGDGGAEGEGAAAAVPALADGVAGPRRRAAFDEDAQANLYNRLQAAQRQGRRGMGKAAVKIAGGNWQGKRTAFGDDDDVEGGGAAGPGAAGAPAAADGDAQLDEICRGGTAGIRGKKRRRQQHAGEASGGSTGGGVSGSGKAKWAKLAVAELKRSPQRRLKWGALWAALWEQDAVAGLGLSAKEAKAACWAKLCASSKVHVSGKKVKLVD